ncbi:MAG: hypothetical protein R6U78_02405 [Bacteroidales bacterium]
MFISLENHTSISPKKYTTFSPDGINWEKAPEYELMPKILRLKSGNEINPDRMECPFVYIENDEPIVISLAVKMGDESYIVFVPVKEKSTPVPKDR